MGLALRFSINAFLLSKVELAIVDLDVVPGKFDVAGRGAIVVYERHRCVTEHFVPCAEVPLRVEVLLELGVRTVAAV